MTTSLAVRSTSALVAALLLAAGLPARAALERVGPVDPANGFPGWYQDGTGLALEFCQPQTQAELDGGWCLLLTGDTTVPEQFPTQFADEHFWWAGNAGVDFTPPAGGRGRALLVLGLEAAFAVGPVIQGDQVAFGRVRVRVDPLPYDGTYTVYHPYGVLVFENQVAGDRLFYTEDVGITCPPGQFGCALDSKIGPFLLPSASSGGAELPPVAGPVPGKLYVADPARLGPVTGSPLAPFVASDGRTVDHNVFRVEGPNGWFVETSDFSLMGRVFTAAIPGRVSIDRASYTRDASEATHLDVFATAHATTQGRLPGAPRVPAIQPVLAFYPAPCDVGPTGAFSEPAGVPGHQMFDRGSSFWGQGPLTAIPTHVCVEDYTARDATGQVVPAFFQAPVADLVTVSAATYDPKDGTLSVAAGSSDALGPILTLGGGLVAAPGDQLVAGRITVPSLNAPPATVRVVSAQGGIGELPVTTLLGAAGGPVVPVAGNDEVTISEDSSTATFDVLANDTIGGAPISFRPGVVVAITGAPRLGTASVVDGKIAYTPAANANGLEGIAYTVTVDGVASSAAYVTIHITPVNDAPVAVADAFATVAGVATTIPVLANDLDVDGAADLAAAELVGTLPAGATITGGPTISFTAASAGTYSFGYRAKDKAGATSAPVTVTVTVAARETLAITLAQFRADVSRFRVTGTSTIAQGQTVTVVLANGTAPGTLVGTAVVDGAGAWAIDLRPGVDPRRTNATQVRATSPLGGSATATIQVK